MISILILAALGHTINTMTLGGMALAVGILVDDATVEIENIHRNLAMGKPLKRAILDGAEQIAVPAFVSTLSICIVFIPVSFLSGAAQSLFTPLGMAVVFAMMASYFLSRTLVPTMINTLLVKEVELYRQNAHELEEEGIHVEYTPELDENGSRNLPSRGTSSGGSIGRSTISLRNSGMFTPGCWPGALRIADSSA